MIDVIVCSFEVQIQMKNYPFLSPKDEFRQYTKASDAMHPSTSTEQLHVLCARDTMANIGLVEQDDEDISYFVT